MDRNIVLVAVVIAAILIALVLVWPYNRVQPKGPTTCSEVGGSVCSASESCPGAWLRAFDTNRCCDSECRHIVSVGLDNTPGGIKPATHPFLWEIERDPPSYLFGTIHVPDDRILALPDSVIAAFEDSDIFYAEIPLDMTTTTYIAGKSMLPRGQTLKALLPNDVYQRAKIYVEAKGYSMSAFNSFKIWAFAGTLALLDYLDVMLVKQPLDIYLYSAAVSAGKETGGLETADEQLDIFESFNISEQIMILNMTLAELEMAEDEGLSVTEELVETYLSGNETLLLEETMGGMPLNDSLAVKYGALVLTTRNHRMADRIAHILADNPGKSYFFAVGTAHYPGEDGILALLADNGFSVTRVVSASAEDPRGLS